MEGLFVGLLFGSPVIMLLIMIFIGCVELMHVRKLGKNGKVIEGRIELTDLKAARPGGVYGKVRFSYHINDRIYTKTQTVDKDTAIALLSGPSTTSWVYEPRKVNVLYLPKRPSIARLVIAPSDRMKMLNFVVALLVLGFLVVLALAIILKSLNTQPNY